MVLPKRFYRDPADVCDELSRACNEQEAMETHGCSVCCNRDQEFWGLWTCKKGKPLTMKAIECDRFKWEKR